MPTAPTQAALPSAAFTFAAPPRLVVGWGAATDGRLAVEAQRLGSRPLLVFGKSLRTSRGLDRILASLRAAGVTPTLHEGVPPEPDLEAVKRCREAARLCDSVIAIGGGSVLDVAKAAAALATAEGAVRDYFDGWRTVPERGGLPILAAPTTAGTGSEATWVGVFTDRESHRKASIRGGAMMPAVAVLDAELTVSCPRKVTIDSGMDAFVQAVESFTSNGANPLTSALAFSAARHASYAHVERAAKDLTDRALRESLALGSLMAGMALNTSRLGLVHGLAAPVGALSGAAHGAVCALLLPAVMRFNLPTVADRYAELAVHLLGPDVADLAPNQAAERLIADIEATLDRLGHPRTLTALGLTAADIDQITRDTMASGSTKANPRPVTANEVRDFTQSLL